MNLMVSGESKDDLPSPIIAIIVLVTLLVISGGILFYNSQKNKIVNEKQNELAAIASLKITEIEKWRMEHIRDGGILRGYIPRNQLISNFLSHENSPGLGVELLERMKIFISSYDYHSMLLVDSTGTTRLVYPPADMPPPLTDLQLHKLQDPEISFSDLHYSNDLPGKVHIDLQIPLVSTIDNNNLRFGTLLLRIDPEKFLYPLIQSWPTPSESSEILLIRMEDDSVLFLNELRHRKNTALKFKLPINDELPAAKAVMGHEGMFEGIDYRGIEVISFLKSIPDSPWFIVAKVDKEEIYAPLNEVFFFISVIVFLLILLVSGSVIYLWRSQHIRYLRELNSTKDKFFSIVSHDLRSPFTSINGFADILVEDLGKEDISKINFGNLKKYAGIIRESSQNAVDLLRNLTEWSRLNTGRLAFNPREIDLASIINEAVDLMSAAAIQKSISIDKTVPTHLKMYADKQMLGLVLRNLISNSIKFTNPGGKIHISGLEEENRILVEVCDTGIGIKKETIQKLFRIDENITTPGTQREHGTGLGLILVKEFVSLHGGQVNVESEVGKCSRFSLTLPVNH